MINVVKFSNVSGREIKVTVFSGSLSDCNAYLCKVYLQESKNPMVYKLTRGFCSMTSKYDDGIFTEWYLQD